MYQNNSSSANNKFAALDNFAIPGVNNNNMYTQPNDSGKTSTGMDAAFGGPSYNQ